MLDPFEEQLDLSANFVNIGNSVGSEFEVISQESVMNAGIGVFIANTTQPDRAVFRPGAGEFDGLNTG